ncbi:MAG: TraR/DksA C4-type zinc finger protein [Pyrinomonadaceae bacterium]
MRDDIDTNSVTKALDAEEARIRAALEADSEDVEELKSEWQERDSPSESNLRAVEWNQYVNLQDELVEINDARARLAHGSYGLCEDCGEPIALKRLENLPAASRCIACQEITERETEEKNRAASR